MFRRHRLERMNVNFAELSIPQQPKFATAGIITFKRTFCSLSTNQEERPAAGGHFKNNHISVEMVKKQSTNGFDSLKI